MTTFPLSLVSFEDFGVYKIEIHFDSSPANAYVARSDSDGTNSQGVLVELHLDESDAITSGNPVGIMSPKSCSLSLWDQNNLLVPTNVDSPYHGKMRNGVEVRLFASYDEGETWESFGIYYVDSWSSVYQEGAVQPVNISCVGKLAHIGKMEIPSLSSYVGVDIVELLEEIFTRIGLTEFEYQIEESLRDRVHMIVSITRGSLLREVLNTIAQALLARIVEDRNGVIRVRPAFPDYDDLGELSVQGVSRVSIDLNPLTVYTRVVLYYNEVDDNIPSSVIYSQNNIRLKPGVNEFTDIIVDTSILAIDGVTVSYSVNDQSYLDVLKAPRYNASQRGLDIYIENTTAEDIYVGLAVEGRITGLSDAFVEKSVTGTQHLPPNTLSIDSYVIQDKSVAQNYVNNLADYLYNMEHKITVTGFLNPRIPTGKYLTLNTGNKMLDGVYYIEGYTLDMSYGQYNVTLDLIKVRWAT